MFHGQRIQTLLRKHGVTELTGPRHYPQYNGKKERSIRDIKSFERAMRRHGRPSTLRRRIDAAVLDLNQDRPRPVLAGSCHHVERGQPLHPIYATAWKRWTLVETLDKKRGAISGKP
jgi:transposase InsO family protein